MTHENISFAVERVTPAKARKYLENNAGNRKPSKRTVSDYAEAIRKGEWMLNGETIKFCEANRLLDGQHRLLAIVQAETPLDLCIVRGLSANAFGTLDGGRKRTQADFLFVMQYRNPHSPARAGRMLFSYERCRWGLNSIGKQKASNDELLATLKRHPGLVEASDTYMRKPYFTDLIPHSTGTFLYYLASKVSSRTAQTFFTELATSEYSSKNKTHPPRVLHDRLQQTSLEVLKPSPNVKLVWCITAWNHFMNRQPLARLPRLVDALPRLHPDPIKAK